MEVQYASNGKANAGLTTGIIGTALSGLLTLGGMAGLANNNVAHGNTVATKDDIMNLKELMSKDQQIAILTSEQNTEVKIADVYERLITRINADQRAQAEWNTQQAVNNSAMSSAIASNAKSIEVLKDLTKVVIPMHNICPRPMPRYNSWEAPVAEEATPTT